MPKRSISDAMTLRVHARSLRYFEAIRRYGSIREAARQLHVASSAVNRQLLKLEDEVGAPLFERLATGLVLTAEGRLFARHVVTVLQDAHRFESEMDALRGIQRGEISILAVEGLNATFLPDVIECMHARFPGIRFSVHTAGSATIAEGVIDGRADLGLAFSLTANDALSQLAGGSFQIGAIVSANHPLAQAPSVTFAQCAKYPLILADTQLSIHALLEPLVRRYTRPLDSVLVSDSIALMREMAARGAGIGFQTRLGLERDLAAGTLRHIPLRAPRAVISELGVYARAARVLTPALDAFVDLVTDALAARERVESALP